MVSSKYHAVYEELRKMAALAEDGEKLPSIKQLCQQFSVSLATLNSALDLLAKDGLIRREPKRGIYFIRTRQPRRSWKVTLVLPGDQEPLFVTIITAVHRYLRERDVELTLGIYELTPESETEELRRLCSDNSCDGVLLLPWTPLFDTDLPLKWLQKLTAIKPVVQFDRKLGQGLTSFVGYECYKASYAATRYLIDCGHTNIGLIKASNDDEANPSDRLRGFFQAMRDAGLSVNSRNTIIYDVMNPDLSNGVLEILSSANCPTAFYAVNSVYLPYLMRKVDFVGKRIPNDVSFICCDLSDTMANMPLRATHFSQPTAEVVCKAAELLLAELEGSHAEKCEIRMPAVFVEGESCRTISEIKIPNLSGFPVGYETIEKRQLVK